MALKSVKDALALPKGDLVQLVRIGDEMLPTEVSFNEQRAGTAYLVLARHGDLDGIRTQAALIKRRDEKYPDEEPIDDGPGLQTIEEVMALPEGELDLPLGDGLAFESSFDEETVRMAFDLLKSKDDTRALFTQAAVVRRYMVKYGGANGQE